jgi:basic membrane lipoprotein Med (substrate-binding protein (PBP1-ABC) superfamily)
MGVICERVRGYIDALKDMADDLDQMNAIDLGDSDRREFTQQALRIMNIMANKQPWGEAMDEHQKKNDEAMERFHEEMKQQGRE